MKAYTELGKDPWLTLFGSNINPTFFSREDIVSQGHLAGGTIVRLTAL